MFTSDPEPESSPSSDDSAPIVSPEDESGEDDSDNGKIIDSLKALLLCLHRASLRRY